MVAITASVIGINSLISNSVDARPSPDRLGICYYVVGDRLESRSSCVISTGYGTGVHYLIQQWNNGNRVEVYMDYSSAEANITVNGKPAKESYRDAGFFHRTSSNDESSLSCYDIIGTNESVCSKFADGT